MTIAAFSKTRWRAACRSSAQIPISSSTSAERFYYCAGAIADLYAHMGGAVYWAGKPYLSAYETAHRKAEALRDANVPRDRILVIGDSLRTDMKGAQTFGSDALFIASGIHRHETMDEISLSPKGLNELFGPGAPPAIGAMVELSW